MDVKIREALENEVLYELQSLNEFDLGSKEHIAAVDNVVKLYKLGLEDIKVDADCEEKWNRRQIDAQHEENEKSRQEAEELHRTEQERERRILDYARLILELTMFIGNLGFCSKWMKNGFEFEKTGTFTSSTFRWLHQKFKPTRK